MFSKIRARIPSSEQEVANPFEKTPEQVLKFIIAELTGDIQNLKQTLAKANNKIHHLESMLVSLTTFFDQCGQCQKVFDVRDHINNKCEECWTHFCDACVEIETCDQCEDKYCPECWTDHYCEY